MVKTHLSARSDFSIGESILSIDAIVSQAKALGYDSVALVDSMSINGLVDLHGKAKKAGIKPIIGCTLRVYEQSTEKVKAKDNGFYTLKAYALSEAGLQQLFRLLTQAHDETHFYYNARTSLDEVIHWLKGQDVAITTGDLFSVFHRTDCHKVCRALSENFRHFFIEYVPIATPLFDTLNARAADVHAGLADAQGLITYPALYPQGKDRAADVHRAITTNAKMTDGWLMLPYIRDFEMIGPTDLVQKAKRLVKERILSVDQLKAALKGADHLATLAKFEFSKKAPSLPKMAADENRTLVNEVVQGWRVRFAGPVLGHQPSVVELQKTYKPRLQYELGVIEKMGFAGYFLLAQEIVQWSKSNGIMVGPGRGSVGGSLVAYLLGITDVDPIRFNLLFERFINPDRIDLPDADLDFMSMRRTEVIEHIEQKYGKENVAGISNYSMLGAASAIRDVSRVHGLEPIEYSCSKQVEKIHGVALNLEESAKAVPDIEKFKNERPVVWENATALEGVMRNLGRHAAGIVVAGEPVINRAVVETRGGVSVVNWDKRTVEDLGLIKMDILGLSTLDMLDLARTYVHAKHGVQIDYLSLPLDDPKVLAGFASGDTAGVFQFESAGMRNLLKQMAMGSKLTFEDCVAATALFRPGPLDAGLCEDYIQIKQGAKAIYVEHPNMEAALRPTLGVIIYQEQVMQICRDVAGFSMAEADHVRKAMGKKDKDKMAEWRTRFVEGAEKVSGMGDFQAGSLWDKIEVFAGYAFNRSHSVEYTIISWWSMWLKTHYPAEFYAASMTVVENEEKLQGLVIDARKVGIQVYPPDINKASDRVEILETTPPILVAPFKAVKGVSDNTAHAIVKLRAEGGEFKSKKDLEDRIKAAKVGRAITSRARDALDAVGAFHYIEGGAHPMATERLKARLEFMPGYTCDAVKADRVILNDKATLSKLVRIASDVKVCDGCSLKDSVHVMPKMGKTPKFIMVFDAPNFKEEAAGSMLMGDSAEFVKAALKDAGLSPNDGYYTALVKAPKPKEQKGLANDQINGCSKWLEAEIAALQPPVIVAMGANATRYFAPGTKGSPGDLAGKTMFDAKRDASIIFGINPAQVVFDPSKTALLQKVAQQIAELVV